MSDSILHPFTCHWITRHHDEDPPQQQKNEPGWESKSLVLNGKFFFVSKHIRNKVNEVVTQAKAMSVSKRRSNMMVSLQKTTIIDSDQSVDVKHLLFANSSQCTTFSHPSSVLTAVYCCGLFLQTILARRYVQRLQQVKKDEYGRRSWFIVNISVAPFRNDSALVLQQTALRNWPRIFELTMPVCVIGNV